MLSDEYFENNKYYHWYIKLVQSRQVNELGDEKHHILPKSLGGSNKLENLVKLSYKEHYLAHILLWKCAKPGIPKQKMAHAITIMKIRPGVKITSRRFEEIKKQSKLLKQKQKGWFSAVDNLGQSFRVHNSDQRLKTGELVACSKGRLLGRSFTEDHKRKLAKSKVGSGNPNHKWIINTPEGVFGSLGAAAKHFNVSRTTVLNRCNNPNFNQWNKSARSTS